MAIFMTKAARIKQEMAHARAEFQQAVDPDAEGRTMRQLRRRIANRCRSHIDKTFIDAAEQTATYEELLLAAKQAGEPPPDPPRGRTFVTVPALDREVYSYMPEEIVDQVFDLGRAYQTVMIGPETAISRTQGIAEQLCEKLDVDPCFEVLQFLREQLEAEAEAEMDVEADDI